MFDTGYLFCLFVSGGEGLVFFCFRKTVQKNQNTITVVNSFGVAITAIKYLQSCKERASLAGVRLLLPLHIDAALLVILINEVAKRAWSFPSD